jgi:hypothetical protein
VTSPSGHSPLLTLNPGIHPHPERDFFHDHDSYQSYLSGLGSLSNPSGMLSHSSISWDGRKLPQTGQHRITRSSRSIREVGRTRVHLLLLPLLRCHQSDAHPLRGLEAIRLVVQTKLHTSFNVGQCLRSPKSLDRMEAAITTRVCAPHGGGTIRQRGVSSRRSRQVTRKRTTNNRSE